MRVLLHGPAKVTTFSPSAAFSVVAHIALIGSAVYGTDRASRAIKQEIAERVYFLPPPDRAPSGAPVPQPIHYRTGREGVHRDLARPTRGVPGTDAASHTPSATVPRAPDAMTDAPPLARPVTKDSVYSILSVDESASRVEGSAAPLYPTLLLQHGVEGSVIARFVVDSTGRSEESTIEILESSRPEFAESVREALTMMRFSPGVVAGRKVRQLVEQRFLFHITLPVPATMAEHTRVVPAP